MPRKALFLDRDGVINVDIGYASTREQIIFIDGIFDVCRAAHALDYLLIIVTNQSGIGRGFYSEDAFHTLMQWMRQRFAEETCPLTAYYHCPHHPDNGCACRKPKAGMLLRAQQEWDIDLAQSILIGDHERDLIAGRAAGLSNVYLFDGKIWPILRP